MSMSDGASEKKPRLEMVYSLDGELYTLMIEWRGEKIQVIYTPGNGTTRELQRAAEPGPSTTMDGGSYRHS